VIESRWSGTTVRALVTATHLSTYGLKDSALNYLRARR
jgi:hypothetical protein